MSKANNRQKATYWDIVINNYSTSELTHLKKVCHDWGMIEDAGWELEIAPTTETPHVQGFIKIAKQVNKSYLLNGPLNEGELKDRISMRPARNWRALINYCQKDHNGTYWNLKEELKAKAEDDHIEYLEKIWNCTINRDTGKITMDEGWDEGYTTDGSGYDDNI